MKILITGGAGFIGSHTADALLKEGHTVRVLDSLEPPVHPRPVKPNYLDSKIEFILGDVRDAKTVLSAMQGVDVIYHLAAFQDYLPTFSRFFDVNVTSTALIYELIVREKLPISKVIVASSQATLGEGRYLDANGSSVLPNIRTDEQLKRGLWECQITPAQTKAGIVAPLKWQRTDESVSNPQNQYGISKIAEEKVALHLGMRYDIPTVAMRYSIVQGPRQSFYNAYSGACRVFSLAFFQGVEPTIFEDGLQIRDFVNIYDVVDANLLVMEDQSADFEMFHVGGDNPITVSKFASIVAEVYGHRDYVPQSSGRYRFGDTRHICSDIDKLKSLGWSPTRTMHQSVEEYKEWLSMADDIPGILAQAQKQMEALNVVRKVDA